MSYGETITRNDLKAVLDEVLPVSYSLSSVKTVTLPFTPTSNGLLIGLIRTSAQGRAYVSLNNTTPALMDGFNVAQGYYCATVFAEKGKQISVASTYNVMQQLYFFVSLGNDSLTDYIVEQGTNDGWTYRKWASGDIDAFKRYSFGSQTGAVWVSPVRYTDLTFTFPDGMFASTPFVTGTAITNQWWVVQVAATSKTGGPIRVATVSSSAANVDVSISAHGKWK